MQDRVRSTENLIHPMSGWAVFIGLLVVLAGEQYTWRPWRTASPSTASTVVLPPTTPSALETLQSYWERGERPQTVLLDATSFPSVETLAVTE